MTKSVEATAADIAADLAALRHDVARLAATMGELVQQRTEAASRGISDAVGDVSDRIVSTAADARSKTREAGGEIRTSIEQNPMAAMLVAFAVGLSVGVVSRARR